MQKSDVNPVGGEPIGNPYALWLIPKEEQRGSLQTHIRALADGYGLPLFGPHLTLCFGRTEERLEELSGRVDRLCAQVRPVIMRVNGAGQTDSYFTFLFLWLIANKRTDVFERASAEFAGAQLSEIGPHLSLMYSNRYEEIDRKRIIQTALPKLPPEIFFDRIQLIMPLRGRWDDVQDWSVWHTACLSG